MSDLLQRSPIRPFSPFVLLRFSKEVATFLSYFYLFISFCKILSSLVNSSLHNFTSPFSPSFPPLLNYDSKHRLPLFSLLFIVFFSSILINGSPLFVASLNEFRSDWILSFPFSFPFSFFYQRRSRNGRLLGWWLGYKLKARQCLVIRNSKTTGERVDRLKSVPLLSLSLYLSVYLSIRLFPQSISSGRGIIATVGLRIYREFRW